MKKKIIFVIFCLIVCLFIRNFVVSKQQRRSSEAPVYWVLSDTHLISENIHDEGKAFEGIKQTAAGKELEYQEESLQALVDSALKEKPTGLVITGDLTLNGEKKSAERLAELMSPLEAEGIQCLVLPGNHDIQDGWAREFKEEEMIKTDQISSKEFEKIFEQSFKEAKSRDKDSLSYSVDINDDFQFLMLDTAIYNKAASTTSPRTAGKLKKETLDWLTKQLEMGEKEKKETIVFMHHNLFKHNELVYEGFVLDNNEELKKKLNTSQVHLVFSGHTHAKSVARDEKTNLTEIVSPSYSMTEQIYGKLSLSSELITYEKKRTDVDSWAKKNKKEVEELVNYRAFTKDLFIEDGKKMAYAQLIENGLYDEESLDQIAEIVGEANWCYFTGNNKLSEEEIGQLKESETYQLMHQVSPALGNYMDSIISSGGNNDYIEIKLDE